MACNKHAFCQLQYVQFCTLISFEGTASPEMQQQQQLKVQSGRCTQHDGVLCHAGQELENLNRQL